MIEQLRGGDSDRLLCEALDVHRSSLYHEPGRTKTGRCERP